MVDAAVGLAIAQLALQFLQEDSSPWAKMLKRDIGEDVRQQVFKASRQYADNYEKRHGTLKVTCVRMDQPVALEEVYTAVKLLNRSDLRYFESPESLEEWFRESGRRGLGAIESEKRQGIEVANQEQYLMVLGSPGIGKSTYLRKVGLEALKYRKSLLGQPSSQYQHNCVPVFLELQRFRSRDKSIEQRIADELETCGFPKAKAFAEFMLDKGKMLVLLDGLDEVPKEQEDAVVEQIRDFVDRYSDNRFITSCRIAAYKGGFRRFKDVVMAEFEDSQIQIFINNWFRKPRDLEQKIADKCWQLLQNPEYAATKELAQTPLLLTLLCAVYDKYQHFPKNRVSLYGEALDVVLREWAAEKRIHDEPIYRELPIELEREFLAELAFDNFKDGRLFFNRGDVTRRIKAFLMDNLNAPKHLDSEAVMREIEVQQGILVERASDTCSFSHLTFQEYLTAQHIVDNQQVAWLVINYLADQQWREVFLLVAGLMRGRTGADDLLLAMEKQANSYLTDPELAALIQWADRTTADSKNTSKPAAKRAGAVFFALARALDLARAPDLARACDRALDLNHAHAHAHNLDFERALGYARNLDLDRARDLDLEHDLTRARDLARARTKNIQDSQIFNGFQYAELTKNLNQLKQRNEDENAPPISKEKVIEVLFEYWSSAFKFDLRQLDNLEKEKREKVENYLYSYELMVKCKEAAVRVSPEVWQGVEDRMLTVPKND